jgi:hypothetical protein
MAIVDDATISNEDILLRILLDDWIKNTETGSRPNSLALLDSNFENSCFISNAESLTELQRLFPGLPVAGIPVEVIRTEGFVVGRRPNECPSGYAGDPNGHVVVGPPEPCGRKDYQRKSQAIVKDRRVFMLRLLPQG